MGRQQGFTFFELIVVIAIMGVVYSVALPKLQIQSGTEVATKLGTLSSDIRAAYDLAVLSRKHYRLVMNFASGDYWLESTEAAEVLLGDEKLGYDLSEEDEKAAVETFDVEFAEYASLAGPDVDDVDGKRTVKATSPLVAAKDKLAPTTWTKIKDREWGERSLGPNLLIQSIQCEHHREKQTLEAIEGKGRGLVFFFPQGYIEKCVLHIAYRKGDGSVDEVQPPYTVITNSYLGTAEVRTGIFEYEQVIHEEDQS